MRTEVFDNCFLIGLLFLSLIFVGTFIVLPPTGNVNDTTTDNVLVHYKLIKYLNSEYSGTFSQFIREDYQDFHGKQLNSNLHPSVFGVTETEDIYFHRLEQVKVLQRLIQYVVRLLTFQLFDLEILFSVVINVLTTALTFTFAYLFGRELSGKTFGMVLAVAVGGNVYFSQLICSGSHPQISLYPLLFFMSFLFLFSLHSRPLQKRFGPLLDYPFHWRSSYSTAIQTPQQCYSPLSF